MHTTEMLISQAMENNFICESNDESAEGLNGQCPTAEYPTVGYPTEEYLTLGYSTANPTDADSLVILPVFGLPGNFFYVLHGMALASLLLSITASTSVIITLNIPAM